MSAAFTDWESFAVPQRRTNSGCIPTGYEMLLRAAGAQGIDFASFQDEFDLDQNLKPGESPRNNFVSVADAVRQRYPNVKFHRVGFAPGRGGEKLKFVEDQIAQKKPVLVSIAQKPFGGQGWHIMPVVNATDHELILLNKMRSDGERETLDLRKDEFVRIHDQCDGGDDVAYLEGWE